jgi:hypothetical protein
MRGAWILVALLVGIAIGVAITRSLTKNDIYVKVDPTSKRALLNPQKGDVVHFRTPLNNKWAGVPPQWVFNQSPCSEKAGSDTCTVTATANNYSYDCPNTTPCDPEVPIGNDVGSNKGNPAGANNSTAQPVIVDIGCNGNSAALKPQAVSVSIAAHGAIDWSLIGNSTDWNVANWTPSSPCQESTINQGATLCTLKVSPSATPYAYTATVNSCSNPTIAGTVTVIP